MFESPSKKRIVKERGNTEGVSEDEEDLEGEDIDIGTSSSSNSSVFVCVEVRFPRQ